MSMFGHEANHLRAYCYLSFTGYATSVFDLAGCITRAGGELRLTPLCWRLCLLPCLLPAVESILTIALARGWVMACLPLRLSRTLITLFCYGGVKADRSVWYTELQGSMRVTLHEITAEWQNTCFVKFLTAGSDDMDEIQATELEIAVFTASSDHSESVPVTIVIELALSYQHVGSFIFCGYDAVD